MPPQKNILQKAWDAWMAIGEFTGNIVSFLVLQLVYWVVFTPLGALYNLHGRLTGKKKSGNWETKEQGTSDYEPY